MRNITDVLARYLSDINLPSVSIIDVIEIILISFFVYQFMVWIKFTRAYTLLKGLLVIGAFLIIAYIFKMNTILWIVSRLAGALITAIVVIFQPELRKVIEQLGQKKIMASIIPFDAGKEVTESSRGHAVTISLDREVDVSRGCVLVHNAKPKTGNLFTAKILWMDDTHLVAGKNYLLKLGTKMIPAVVMNIKYKIDVNTGNEVHADAIYKNEIAACDIAVSDKIVFEKFKDNHALGSMILIDRITNMTSACGVIMHALRRTDNLTWHEMDITREFRAQQKGQTPKTIWLTGLSGSGKSTLANELEKRLVALGKHTMLLDGDNVRMGLNKNLGFKEADRIENIRRIAEVAKLMNDAGLIVITSFISPYVRDRRNAREIIGEDSFIEVYVSTPVEECEKRDVKGLYKKARTGEIPNFTGISSPYEVPEHPEVTIDTTGKSLEDSVDYVMAQLEEKLG